MSGIRLPQRESLEPRIQLSELPYDRACATAYALVGGDPFATAPVRPRRGLTQGTITEARVTDEVTGTVVFDSLAGIWHR